MASSATPGSFARAYLAFFRSARSRAAGRRRSRHDEHGFVERPRDGTQNARPAPPYPSTPTGRRRDYVREKELAKLRPNVKVGCGHGIPRSGMARCRRGLERFAEQFRAPRHGRYVRRPARDGRTRHHLVTSGAVGFGLFAMAKVLIPGRGRAGRRLPRRATKVAVAHGFRAGGPKRSRN